jgi:hypothetical protein
LQYEQNPHLNRVGIWELIYIDDYQSFQSISAASHLYKKEIGVLADYYVSTKHKIPTDGTMTILQVIEAVLFVPPATDAVARLLQRFKTECNPSLYNEFKDTLEEVVAVTSTEATNQAIERLDLDEDIKELNRERNNLKKRKHGAVLTAPTEVLVQDGDSTTNPDVVPLLQYV